MSFRQGWLFRSFPRPKPRCLANPKRLQIHSLFHGRNRAVGLLLQRDALKFAVDDTQGDLGTFGRVQANRSLGITLRHLEVVDFSVANDVDGFEFARLEMSVQIASLDAGAKVSLAGDSTDA